MNLIYPTDDKHYKIFNSTLQVKEQCLITNAVA